MEYFHFLSVILVLILKGNVMNAISPGPDTIIVNEHTYYEYGFDPGKVKTLNAKHKFKHSSILSLEALIDLEWQIYSNVTQIYKIHQENNQLPKTIFTQSVEEYLLDFRTTSLALIERRRSEGSGASVIKILSTNIITPFLATRRFRNYIRPWMVTANGIKNRTCFQDSVIRHINSVYQLKHGPFAVEFQISMMSILIPHFIYDLRAEDIAEGSIMRGNDLGVTLKACHCLEIGVQGIATALFPLGIEWLEVTIDKINSGDDTTDLSLAISWLERAVIKHDKHWKPLDGGRLQEIYFSKPLANLTSGEERKWRKQLTCEERDSMELLVDPAEEMPWHLHASVCKGDVQQSEQEKSKLFCWYERKVHPVWTIGPLKAEFISRFPLGEVIQFYDLVTNDELTKALETDPKNTDVTNRILVEIDRPGSKRYLKAQAEIHNEEIHFLSKLETLVEAVSGLRGRRTRIEAGATYYVPGGHAFTHEDWLSYDERYKKHTVALLMLYTEQPDVGGETTFPRSLVKTNPLKGSAVFSFSLLRSGRKDFYAPHGACPLIFGGKWMLIKSLIYEDQAHVGCGLQENLRHEYLVNGKTKSK